MGKGIATFFLIMILAQLFYSFGINIIIYSLPVDAIHYVTEFSEPAQTIDLEDTGAEIENSLSEQTNMPLIDLGALAFYSGNIFIDLLLNFFLALPQMFTLLIKAATLFISIDYMFLRYIQLFATIAVGAWYVLSIILFLASIRTGRAFT